jgi:hypothetical protein
MTGASVAVVCFTDGRYDCIGETIASFEDKVALGPGKHWRLIFDDSADPLYREFLQQEYGERYGRVGEHPWTVLPNARRLGFGGTIHRAWEYLSFLWTETTRAPAPTWVFHLEDDFGFDRPVDLVELMAVMEHRHYLVQMALVRQAWSIEERKAGGVVSAHRDEYQRRQVALYPRGESSPPRLVEWLEHRLFFTTNPSLYRRSLCAEGWPEEPNSEGLFWHRYREAHPDAVCGYWGDSTPWVTHIGATRNGTGY